MSEDKREELERIESQIESMGETLRFGKEICKEITGEITLKEITAERSLGLKGLIEDWKQEAAELRVELKEDDEDVSAYGPLHKIGMALRNGFPIFDANNRPLPDAARNQLEIALKAFRQQVQKIVIDNGGTPAPSLRDLSKRMGKRDEMSRVSL